MSQDDELGKIVISGVFDKLLQNLNSKFKEADNILGGIRKIIDDIVNADIYPLANSVEKQRRQNELFDFVLKDFFEFENYLNQVFNKAREEEIQREELQYLEEINYEKEKNNQLERWLQQIFLEKQKLEDIIFNNMRLELMELRKEVDIIYQQLGNAVKNLFINILAPTNPTIDIKELGVKVEINEILEYMGEKIKEKIDSGELKSKDVESEIHNVDYYVPDFFDKIVKEFDKLTVEQQNNYIEKAKSNVKIILGKNKDKIDKLRVNNINNAIQADIKLNDLEEKFKAKASLLKKVPDSEILSKDKNVAIENKHNSTNNSKNSEKIHNKKEKLNISPVREVAKSSITAEKIKPPAPIAESIAKFLSRSRSMNIEKKPDSNYSNNNQSPIKKHNGEEKSKPAVNAEDFNIDLDDEKKDDKKSISPSPNLRR